MKINWHNILKALSIPLTLLLLSLSYQFLWSVFNWPKGDELIAVITKFFNTYGLWVVLLCSILESALIVGNYFPGGVVIFLSVIVAGHNIPKIIFTVAAVSLGFFLGYFIDYLLGKYGWYKLLMKLGLKTQLESAGQKLSRHSLKAILASYWEPNLASVTATAAGILQIPPKKFLWESLVGIIIWNTFWGTFVATLGKNALELAFNWLYVLPIAAVWILVVVIKEYKKSKQLIDT